MTDLIWTADDVAGATGGRLVGSEAWSACGVSIDSRTLDPGDLFVALVGPNTDGHKYLGNAFKVGASAAIVSEESEQPGPVIVVPDTLEALNALAIAARDRCRAKRLAVTGSVGKTGTKEMLRTVLSDQAPTHASAKSYNNLWGVPLTLARMPEQTQYGVFEIGMNHAGEITPLTQLVAPDVALITTVAPVHLEFFDSVDAIADAKAEIFDGLKPGGTAIINADIDQTDRLVRAAKRVPGVTVTLFGARKGADVHLSAIEDGAQGMRVTSLIHGQKVIFDLPLQGHHLAMNALAVLASVSALGGDVDKAAHSLSKVKPVKGRGVRHTVETAKGSLIVIDESYNANPTSMAAAIQTLGQQKQTSAKRCIAVLGDMLELGEDADHLHRQLADDLVRAKIDMVFLSGPHMRGLWQDLPDSMRGGYGTEAADLNTPLHDAVCDGDVIMIKGSLGSKMGPIVDHLLDLSIDTPRSADG